MSSVPYSEESERVCLFLDQCAETNCVLRKFKLDITKFTNLCYEKFGKFLNLPTTALVSGSEADGSRIFYYGDYFNGLNVPSDVDLLVVFNNLQVFHPALGESNQGYTPDSWLFKMIECCNPLFLKLKLIRKPILIGDVCSDAYSALSQSLMYKRNCGCKFLSSTELLSRLRVYYASDKLTIEPHGPSVQEIFLNSLFKQTSLCDYVHCIKVTAWPKFFNLWAERQHLTNWLPKQARFSLLGTSKCVLVPVGRAASVERDIEWRVSSSFLEINIFSNFNETQIYCFIILKALLKEHECSSCKELISSYIIKTLIFWTLEWDEDLTWESNELIVCMQRVLTRLYCGIFTGVIPHFFLPSYNLLEEKPCRGFSNLSLQCIKDMIRKITQNVIQNVEYMSSSLKPENQFLFLGNRSRVKFLESQVHLPLSRIDSRMYQNSMSRDESLIFQCSDSMEIDPGVLTDEHTLSSLNSICRCLKSYVDFSKIVGVLKKSGKQCLNSEQLNTLENIDFINKSHSDIKVALIYMHQGYFEKARKTLDKTIDIIVSNFLKQLEIEMTGGFALHMSN